MQMSAFVYIDRFYMDDKVGSILYLDPESYPTSLSDTFFKELTELPIHSIYSIDYEPIPQDVALKTLEDKLMGVENTIAKQQDKRNKRGAFSSDISYKVRREKKNWNICLMNLGTMIRRCFGLE